MNILVACECSGRVKNAFRKRGHNAWSCDTKPSEILDDKFHYQCDVREVLNKDWDLMIAHPDCTYLANSGVRWLFEKEGRWEQLRQASEFFNFLHNQDIPRIAVESSLPHKWATELIGHYSQRVQPYWFGEPYKKGICLWLKNLPFLVKTNYLLPPKENDEKRKWEQVWREPPGINQKTNRARTYQGVADAMAEQWG